MTSLDQRLFASLFRELGGSAGALEAVTFVGPERALPSAYEVSALASASIAAATLAVAELKALRAREPIRAVNIDRVHASRAFQSERLLQAVDFTPPALWDPLAGDYACADGFIRLHTNYSYHRDAVLSVLDVPCERAAVAAEVVRTRGDVLEQRIVDAGGCAAFMRTAADWAAHPQGRALAREPTFALEASMGARDLPSAGASAAPLAGVRVLDLTRVIAGPVCTRLLAAYGADVLRLDPPGFVEVGLLLCDITAGKRRASLDLKSAQGRAVFDRLIAEAHVIVHGYRPDALSRLGYDPARLDALNSDALVICHDAYGWSGPWAGRRGFDSLVQMSCGIAARGRDRYGSEGPTPLPVQALDHATGYLLAAAACRALSRRIERGERSSTRLSLARVARLLMELGESPDVQGDNAVLGSPEPFMETAETQFGRVRRVRVPGHIEGVAPLLALPAGAVGIDSPSFR